MQSKWHLLDYSIVFVCRAVRGFFAGIFALVLIENMLVKGLSFAQAGSVQLCLLAGCLLVSKVAARLAKTLGIVNGLVLVSLSKCAATFAFAHAKGANALSTAAVFGCFAIYGEWFCPFLALERVVLAQLAKKSENTEEEYKSKLSNLLVFHNALGYIAQAVGLLVAAKGLHYGFFTLYLSWKQIGETMLTYSAISAFGCLVLYAMLDRKKIQANASDLGTETNSSGLSLAPLIYSLQGIYASIFSQSYFIYLLRIKYKNFYIDIVPTLTIFIFCNIVGFIMFALLRRRINGVFFYVLTSIIPNLLVLLSCFLSLYQDTFRIFVKLVVLFGGAAYCERPGLIRNLFPGMQKASVNWLVPAAYIVGGAIGFTLQRKYEMDDLLLAIAGISRLLVDVIILTSYSKRGKEIGSFNDLLEPVLPEKSEQESQKITSYEEI